MVQHLKGTGDVETLHAVEQDDQDVEHVTQSCSALTWLQ
jgi:hypothetical protein